MAESRSVLATLANLVTVLSGLGALLFYWYTLSTPAIDNTVSDNTALDPVSQTISTSPAPKTSVKPKSSQRIILNPIPPEDFSDQADQYSESLQENIVDFEMPPETISEMPPRNVSRFQ